MKPVASSRIRSLLGEFFASLAIVLLVLLGYWQLFAGADFFVEEDPVSLFDFAHRTAKGNGWRPDKGFGMSLFFGDPGATHPWSIFSLLERMLPFGTTTFTSSVVLLLIAASLSQYAFLKRVAPTSANWAVLLAPLIVFGPLRYEFFFQRLWVTLSIGAPLFLMLLHDYYARPKRVHLLLSSILLWSVLFFGGTSAFVQVLIVGFLFSAVYYQYYKPTLRSIVPRFLLIHAAGVGGTIILGFWVFFSFFVESLATEYTRSPVYTTSGLLKVTPIYQFLVGLLHAGWLPSGTRLAISRLGLSPLLSTISWTNASVVFPVVFISLLLRRSGDFWEFALKWLVSILLVHQFLYNVSPVYSNLVVLIWPGYPLSKFQPAYHPLQIGLLAIYIARQHRNRHGTESSLAGKAQRALAVILLLLYAVPLGIGIVATVNADVLPNLFSAIASGLGSLNVGPFMSDALRTALDRLSPPQMQGYPKELLVTAISVSLHQIQEAITVNTQVFYILSIIVILMFLWPRSGSGIWASACAVLLLVDAILLSWTIYPLNRSALVWEEVTGGPSPRARFEPFDRFYRVSGRLAVDREQAFADVRRAHSVRSRIGYRWHPALDISSVTSFMPRDSAEFFFQIFNGGGTTRIKSVRGLTSQGPLISSPLLDMAAVSHFYSSEDLGERLRLPVIFAGADLHIWRNTSAWPYFYLAEKVEIKEEGEPLRDPRPATAYVAEEEFFVLAPAEGKSTIRLISFADGELVFDYHGIRDELLIIADAWHPFWKAYAVEKELRVIPANGIFKGIKLPRGRYVFRVVFDTSSYVPGIYVSLVAWGLLVPAWVVARKADERTSLLGGSVT